MKKNWGICKYVLLPRAWPIRKEPITFRPHDAGRKGRGKREDGKWQAHNERRKKATNEGREERGKDRRSEELRGGSGIEGGRGGRTDEETTKIKQEKANKSMKRSGDPLFF